MVRRSYGPYLYAIGQLQATETTGGSTFIEKLREYRRLAHYEDVLAGEESLVSGLARR
jgi:hypothetical protein